MSNSSSILGIDYGPLAGLVGTWQGDRGTDIAPERDGPDENPFYETITFEASGDVDNAETQNLAAVRYHQVVHRKSNDEVFHNETGYWLWDADQNVVMQVLAIPRGVCLIAGGELKDRGQLEVRAAIDDPDWGIVQSPFMRDNARTLEFRHTIRFVGDTLAYHETTVVDIYGQRFDHTDENTLTRA